LALASAGDELDNGVIRRRNYTHRSRSCVWGTWAGSFVDRGHHLEENLLSKNCVYVNRLGWRHGHCREFSVLRDVISAVSRKFQSRNNIY